MKWHFLHKEKVWNDILASDQQLLKIEILWNGRRSSPEIRGREMTGVEGEIILLFIK